MEHDVADDGMGFTEGNTAFGEIVGGIGGIDKTAFGCFAHGEAHMVEEGRGKECKIAHGIPAPDGVEHRVSNVGESDEAIGMSRLPQRPRGIEPDVAANGLELPRIEGKLDERRIDDRRDGIAFSCAGS